MNGFYVAFLFGCFQTVLLSLLIKWISEKKRKFAIFLILFNFLCYGVAVATLMLNYFELFIYCFCGYFAGLPLSLVVWFVYKTYLKKYVNPYVKMVLKMIQKKISEIRKKYRF